MSVNLTMPNGTTLELYSNRPHKNKRVYSAQSVTRGKRGVAGTMALSMYFSYPVNVLYQETFTQFLKTRRDIPIYAQLLVPYLDILYSLCPWQSTREEFLEYRADNENRFPVYPRWVDEWERKAIQYLQSEYKSKKQLAELYQVFKEMQRYE